MKPNRVRIRTRADGRGLEVLNLEAAKVRRVVLVADPLEPPRVFLELLGHEVDVDVAALVVPHVAPRRARTAAEEASGVDAGDGRGTFRGPPPTGAGG